MLLLHRNAKADDINEGKWIGVGGKFLDRESPEECLLREVKEETGYTLTSWRFRGIVTFLQENYETEYMCLYTADDFLLPVEGRKFLDIPVVFHEGFADAKATDWPVPECSEGDLAWIPKEKIPELPMWAGDRIFLKLLDEERPFFSLRLEYSGDDLLSASLDGSELTI